MATVGGFDASFDFSATKREFNRDVHIGLLPPVAVIISSACQYQMPPASSLRSHLEQPTSQN